ncbi:MAG TPA: DNA polymerase III subunit gamma and tau [Actinomycetes bacterium]
MALALYRRYRPDSFAEVIGQEHVTGPLQHALANDRVHHAYLFSGPRGCGKTTSARILARALNCEQGPRSEPCGECQSCRDLARGGPGSLDVIEIDAASHGGVDDTRELREKAFYSPASSRYKIYIIDEAHTISDKGFDALLKIVEEPPPHLKFIFATTEPEKVLGTIRSRTHHYPFRLVPPKTLQEHLQRVCDAEGVSVGPGVLPMVVRAATGSVRDALSVLDQLIAGAGPEGVTHGYAASLLGYTDATLLDDVLDAFAAGDGATVFETVDRVIESGIDPRRFAADLLERLRDLVILQRVPDAVAKGLLLAAADQISRMESQSALFGAAELSRAADLVSSGLTEMRGATAPRLQLELICARVLLPGSDSDPERGLRARLDRLERRFAISGPPAEAPAAPVRPAVQPVVERGQPAPESVTAAGHEPVAEPEPAPPAPAEEAPAPGGLDVHSVRRMWPEVLERVKVKRRVTWMMLFDKVQVLGVDGQTLTLGFPDAGSVKNFTSSGHDEVLRQVLIDVLGVDWRIDPVHQPGARPATSTPPPASSGPAAEPAGGPAPAGPPAAAAPADDEVDLTDSDDVDEGLTGAELIARELGGQVIGEVGNG